MIKSMNNFLATLDHAGYVTEVDEYEQVVELDTCFVFMCFLEYDNEYLVGIYHKQGGFEGCPRLETESKSEALQSFLNLCSGQEVSK